MNPITNIHNQNKINQREIDMGLCRAIKQVMAPKSTPTLHGYSPVVCPISSPKEMSSPSFHSNVPFPSITVLFAI